MDPMPAAPISRRRALRTGGIAALALALPACATYPPFSLTEAVRRLLLRASENAFARLTEPGGYWDQRIAGIGLGDALGVRGDVLTRILTSTLFKRRVEDAFADLAIEASFRAAPIVTDAVRVIGLENAVDLVRGGPRAATSALRGELGGRLIEEMVPEVGEAIRLASDPLVAELLNAATGTDVGGVARRLAGEVDAAIWDEIGNEEAAIRADPRSTNDPVLIEVFGPEALS
ncbi:DUF4197 domain-containing protein [Erythrobacter sp.]|uniref:DUF4197 domain-containing protein n=1 Tax=Erythrobacter sp. TaxID=1042 RepID=UPI001425C62B|nr:DUF4197 domain-containing protein [Erythrobacter sp.]QIQ85626.1 MAG: DUF4197 domain-containing protein [Erythrobacter sp.]